MPRMKAEIVEINGFEMLGSGQFDSVLPTFRATQVLSS